MFAHRASMILVAVLALFSLPATAADTYEVDPVHSSFLFRVKHLNVSYTYGRFNESSGAFVLDTNDPANNSVSIEIKTDSVDTGNAARDKHLRGPDFFNAAEFPTMTFRSTSFKKKGDTRYDVTGDLTIHGVTREVTFEAELTGVGKGMKGEQRAGWEATIVIKRSDFGMTFMPDAIGDDVTLRISVEGVKK